MHILSEKFKNFLISEEKISENEIQLSTRIVEDLSLDGIDAHYFIEAYAETFSIEVGDFDFHRYFTDETQVLLIIPAILFVFFRFLIWKLLLGQPVRKLTTVPVTLAMLQQAIDDGVWNCARIESLAGTQVYPPPPKKPGWFSRIRNRT
jgi:acyl carrier protein